MSVETRGVHVIGADFSGLLNFEWHRKLAILAFLHCGQFVKNSNEAAKATCCADKPVCLKTFNVELQFNNSDNIFDRGVHVIYQVYCRASIQNPQIKRNFD